MTIKKGDNGYEGKLFTEGTDYEIFNLQIENNEMTGNFTGENIAGFIFADGQGFELTGTKVK